MAFTFKDLPYDENALDPYISKDTMSFHHGKHYRAYVDVLNEAVKGTEFETMSLADIIRQASDLETKILNNAGQVWNHEFYFNCLAPPEIHRKPQGVLVDMIDRSFGTYEKFKTYFNEVASNHFGSGWVWLLQELDQTLAIDTTNNGDTPIREDRIPLMTCDVWEHAYYIDCRNLRESYLESFWNVANWEFVEKNMAQPGVRPRHAATNSEAAQTFH